VRVSVVLLQVKVSPPVIVAVGGTVSMVTETESVVVHPLAPVAVTIYVPARSTEMESVVCPSVPQSRVVPVDAVAERMTEVVVQLSVPLLIIVTVGRMVSTATTIESVAVHPFIPVTVST
jgi:hypothetical protein